MFACLELMSPACKGIRGWLPLLRAQTELFPDRAWGAQFLRLQAQANCRGKPDWKAVAHLVRPITRHLLVPQGCFVPEHLGFEPPIFSAFERKVLLQCACQLIAGTSIPLYRRTLGIYDPRGELAGEQILLLRHYTSVRVVTQNVTAYQEAGNQAMEELGAPVLLGEEPSNFSDCVLLLCPNDVTEALPLLPACPVLAGGTFADFQGCNVFQAPRVSVSAEHLVQLPQGIDAHTFGAAVFHTNGVWIPTLAVGQLRINGRISSLEEARYIMRREAGYISEYG